MRNKFLNYLLLFLSIIWIGNELTKNQPVENKATISSPPVTKTTPSQHQPTLSSNSTSSIPKNAHSKLIKAPSNPSPATQPSVAKPSQGINSGTFNTLDPNIHHRWPSNHADCVLVTNNPQLIQAYKNAINAWNQTNSFHFNLTNNRNAKIKLGETNLDNTKQEQQHSGYTMVSQELGVTYTSYYDNQPDIIGANVKLDDTLSLLSRSPELITRVAEHELGHAIGLAHTSQNSNSVMVPVNPKTGITNNDVITVKQLYGVH